MGRTARWARVLIIVLVLAMSVGLLGEIYGLWGNNRTVVVVCRDTGAGLESVSQPIRVKDGD